MSKLLESDDPEDVTAFANRVNEFCIDTKVDLRKLAAMFGVSVSIIQKWRHAICVPHPVVRKFVLKTLVDLIHGRIGFRVS